MVDQPFFIIFDAAAIVALGWWLWKLLSPTHHFEQHWRWRLALLSRSQRAATTAATASFRRATRRAVTGGSRPTPHIPAVLFDAYPAPCSSHTICGVMPYFICSRMLPSHS
jgi:hypothetical protein